MYIPTAQLTNLVSDQKGNRTGIFAQSSGLLLLLTSPSHLRTYCCLPFYHSFQNRKTPIIDFTLLTCHNRICILNVCQKWKHESLSVLL